MNKLKRHGLGTWISLLLATLLIVEYQACSPAKFASLDSLTPYLAMNGNGDSYSGKPVFFNAAESGNPCNRLSNQGHPFPSQQIFAINGVYSLVRENCHDIVPRALDVSSLQISADGTSLQYQGHSFALQNDLTEFNQVPVVCSSGKSIDTVMGNLFFSPLNLAESVWRVHPEITAQLDGSIEALPKFRVEVTDAQALEDWRRVSQNANLSPKTDYVTTFLLQAGSSDLASISYNELPAGQFVVVVYLRNVQAWIQYQTGAANPVVTSVQRYGDAVAVSVAFTSSASMNGPGGDIGVAPYRPGNNDRYSVGDSIYATAASLNLCR